MSELWKKSAVDMVDLLRSGDISPVEAAQAAIARIEAVDHNVMITVVVEIVSGKASS